MQTYALSVRAASVFSLFSLYYLRFVVAEILTFHFQVGAAYALVIPGLFTDGAFFRFPFHFSTRSAGGHLRPIR
jgi:hypothetical protein